VVRLRLRLRRGVQGVRDGSRGDGVTEPARIYPHSGRCARCLRERDDLFWHRFDEVYYCADVFRCEARYVIQGEREEAALCAPNSQELPEA
jgi:hypothetical protein